MSTLSKRLYPTASGGTAGPIPTDLHKIKAAAAARNLDEEYVRRLVESRRIPSYKIGKYRLISLADLDALIARGFTPAQEVTSA